MILAVDIGTTFLKVAVIDFVGDIHFFEKSPIEIFSDKEINEVNPLNWWLGFSDLCSKISHELFENIISVVISGNGPTIVPIDSNGKAIDNAYLWMDSRANSVSDEIYDILGEQLPGNFFLSKTYWIKKEKPDIYARASSFLACPEYLSYLLTNVKYTLLPVKGFDKFYWNKEQIVKLSMDSGKFPQFISPYEVYGLYTGEFHITGLKVGTPIVCAGPDFTMSLLGSGSIEEGVLCDRTGTSEGLNLCSKNPYEINGLRTLPHLVGGLHTISGLIPASGEYFLSGDIDTLIDAYRGIVQLMIDNGLIINEIRIVGGHAGVKELNEKKASCFSFPVKIYPEGSELIGNALLGSLVSGYYESITTACSRMVREIFCYNE